MDPRVTEFHCIMPLENIPSVLKHGILSHERAADLAHRSVALQAVQDLRHAKQVPGGLRLHQYANLYFHARNPMLSKRRGEASMLCVLRVSTSVLEISGVVLTDSNASSKFARFLAPWQWRILHFDHIFSTNWKHPDDQIAEWRHSARKCAEVLVPHQVSSQFLTGAYVVNDSTADRLRALGFELPISVDPDLFFR
ncbi:MAG: DUF4433 domain-containing protein [Chthoniobacter sp.]|nr:DUF4433 domain-containing protein [Chthoniobacter sp.]